MKVNWEVHLDIDDGEIFYSKRKWEDTPKLGSRVLFQVEEDFQGVRQAVPIPKLSEIKDLIVAMLLGKKTSPRHSFGSNTHEKIYPATSPVSTGSEAQKF